MQVVLLRYVELVCGDGRYYSGDALLAAPDIELKTCPIAVVYPDVPAVKSEDRRVLLP